MSKQQGTKRKVEPAEPCSECGCELVLCEIHKSMLPRDEYCDFCGFNFVKWRLLDTEHNQITKVCDKIMCFTQLDPKLINDANFAEMKNKEASS